MGRPRKYVDFAAELKGRIQKGIHPSGELLPSESVLGDASGLSRNTIRKALALLKSQGLLTSRGGKGYFVVDANSPSGSEDHQTALIMGLNFSNWNISHLPCMLYTLLEEKLAFHEYSVVHVQPDRFQTAGDLIDYLESFPGDTVVCSMTTVRKLTSTCLLSAFLKKTGKNIIFFDFEDPGEYYPVDMIYTDWQSVLDDVVELILKAGHKKVVYAGYDSLPWSESRRNAFLLALRKAGLWDFGQPEPCVPYPEEMEFDQAGRPTARTRTVAAKNLVKYLRQHPEIDAVVCGHDSIIEEVYRLLPAKKRPYMVGFDNSSWARDNRVPSVAVNIGLMAETLTKLITPHGRHAPVYTGVPAVLMKR